MIKKILKFIAIIEIFSIPILYTFQYMSTDITRFIMWLIVDISIITLVADYFGDRNKFERECIYTMQSDFDDKQKYKKLRVLVLKYLGTTDMSDSEYMIRTTIDKDYVAHKQDVTKNDDEEEYDDEDE